MPESEIQRLLRITANRNKAEEYVSARFKVLETLVEEFNRRAEEDGISRNVIIEACLRGYVTRHPSVLAMIDQWVRDEGVVVPERRAPKISARELAEIYAAAGSGIIDDEDT